MQVFDFDNTIYRGESTFDFAVYVILRRKKLITKLPGIVKILWKYKKCKLSVQEFQRELEKYTEDFLKNSDFIKECVTAFWQKNLKKLDLEMIKKIKKEDAIVTCSPSFLLDEIKDKLVAKRLITPSFLLDEIKDKLVAKKMITSEFDLETGKIHCLNFGKNKVQNFRKKYPKLKIEMVYTDSYNDQALIDIAKHATLVKKGKCIQIK